MEQMTEQTTNTQQEKDEQIREQKKTIETLSKTIEELRGYEKKNYRLNRFRALCSVICLALCIAFGVFLYINGKTIVTKADQITTTVSDTGSHIKTVAEDLEKVEFEKLGKQMQEIADISKDTVQQANEAASGLDKIITTADTALENLNNLKIDALNNGIAKLNELLENLKKFFDKFKF